VSDIIRNNIRSISLNSFHWYTYFLQQRTRTSRNSNVPPGSVPTDRQRDIAAYTHSYDLYSGRHINDAFWGDPKTRRVITKQRFEYHDSNHRPACFKKNSECRFLFPKLPHTKTVLDDNTNDGLISLHRLVEGDVVYAKPWLIYPNGQ
jgi:hypothetical protein